MTSRATPQQHVPLGLRPERGALRVKMYQVPMIPRCIAVFGNHSGPVAFVERLTIFPAKLTHSAGTSIDSVALRFLLCRGQLTASEGRTGTNHYFEHPRIKRRASSLRHRDSCHMISSVSHMRCLRVHEIPKRIHHALRIMPFPRLPCCRLWRLQAGPPDSRPAQVPTSPLAGRGIS